MVATALGSAWSKAVEWDWTGRPARFVTASRPFVKNPCSGPARLPTLRDMRFEFDKFYQAVNATREARAASWRQVAREIGVGKSTLARMAQNRRPDADGLAALSYWAGINPADYVIPETPGVQVFTAHAEEQSASPGSP